jgi:superfamily II DNA/RNA helicase
LLAPTPPPSRQSHLAWPDRIIESFRVNDNDTDDTETFASPPVPIGAAHPVHGEGDDDALPRNGFVELGLSDAVVRAVAEKGYTVPTPIQEQAIPTVLMGRDVLGCAQTGTGKTAGFTLPMLDILSGSRARARMPRSLILEPTRELALQVAENFVQYGKYLKLTHALVIGGESMNDQRDLLMRGVDVLIATPGRLIDMFERGTMLLTDVKILVIDEADRMLDMGFIPDVERIVSVLPPLRQTLFFSATMAPEIKRLADAFLRNPKEITVSKPASVATTITEALVVVAEEEKREALRRLIASEDVQNALIFCNRKRDVDILHKSLKKHGFSVGALHGDMPQPARFATLEAFKAGTIRLLCCSDVAARGIDIGGLSHVFNFDVPHHAEDYVHRIGRTGRAGREGRAFTLATPEDKLAVAAIEALTGHAIPVIAVDGVETAVWAEGDGKRRGRGGRGRAGPKAAARPEREAKPAPRERKRAEAPARAERPVAEQTEMAVGVEVEVPERAAPERAAPERAPVERAPVERHARERRAPERRAPERHAPERHAPERQAPERHAPARLDGERHGPTRSDRDRGDSERAGDRGSVMGFGEDMPAFMRLAKRPERAATPVAAETEEAA